MLVTIIGASRGIGAATANSFAAKGYDVFLASRNTKELEILANEIINKYKIKCEFAFVDSTDKASIEKAAELCVNSMGIPNIVVYNSGISKTDNFYEFKEQIIRDIYEVNVFGMLKAMEVFIPILFQGEGGTFAGVTSLAESRGMPGNAGYTSSKIAASHLLEAARCQLLKSKVKIATIKPGFIATDMTSRNSFPMPFLLTAEQAGEIIATKLIDGKLRISFPYSTAFISWFGKLIPGIIYDNLMKHWKKKVLQD